MRLRYTVALLALGATFLAPGAAWASEDEATTRPAETVLPAICDYFAGECPIVFDPATEPEAPAPQPDSEVPTDAGTDTPPSEPGSGGEGSEEPPPTGTLEPDGGDLNQTGLPPIPAECNQGDGRFVCPDGNPPYGCWAIETNDRVVGICIDPPIDPPIDRPYPPEPPISISLCEWEPTTCQRSLESGPASASSGQPKPKKSNGVKKKAAGKRRAGTKRKAAKNPAAKKSPKSGKRKPKASRR